MMTPFYIPVEFFDTYSMVFFTPTPSFERRPFKNLTVAERFIQQPL